MSIAEQIYEKVKTLPPEQQAEVLDFASLLEEKSGGKRPPLRSPIGVLRGLWKDTPPITEEDIAEARRKMWGNSPKDFPK